jgi:hypothetical protein
VVKQTPQEKKISSYQHDGRNSYGQSDKGSRKRIRRRKTWVNRTDRHAVAHDLHIAGSEGLEPDREVGTKRRKSWKKSADARLVDTVIDRVRRNRSARDAMPSRETALQKEAKRRLR